MAEATASMSVWPLAHRVGAPTASRRPQAARARAAPSSTSVALVSSPASVVTARLLEGESARFSSSTSCSTSYSSTSPLAPPQRRRRRRHPLPSSSMIRASSVADAEAESPASSPSSSSSTPSSTPTALEEQPPPSSPELAALAQAHLSCLPLLLAGTAARRGLPPPLVRASFYSRTPSSLMSGRLVLRRVAATVGNSDAPSSSSVPPPADAISLDGADAAAEDYLTRQRVVALPDAVGGLVLPLSHGRFLVGLLVVELEPTSRRPSRSRPEEEDDDGAYLPDAADEDALVTAASVLAAAASLEARAALDAADAAGRRAAAAALVDAAAGPVAALRTLAAMLLPRTKEGAPEKDMASGIVTQGGELANIVGRLAAALHSPTAATAARDPLPLPSSQQQELLLPPAPPSSPPPRQQLLPPPTATTLSVGRRRNGSSPALGGDGEEDDVDECSPLDVVAEALATAAPRAAALGVALELKVSSRKGSGSPKESEGEESKSSLSPPSSPVEGDADGRASFASLSSSSSPSSSESNVLRLLPRPPRPLRAAIAAATLARATGDAVDSALQRCGRGGKVTVSVSNSSSSSPGPFPPGVFIDVVDSGGDWGMREELMARIGGGGGGGGATAATAMATEATATATATVAPPNSDSIFSSSAAAAMERLAAGLPAGSGAAALAAASRAVSGAGGRVTVTASAPKKKMGEGTRVRMWLPGPGA